MANAFATNFAIPGTSNFFQVIWKLTRVMKAAGWTYKASGNGTTKDTTGTATNDLWGGNANPLLDSYSSVASGNGDNNQMWWVASGPQTVRVPLSANPTGTFLRGESVTQATSGATGELIGYTWDTTSSAGWAVIGPQTGTFDNSHTVTGSISGATFTPTGTVKTYNREICFAKPASDQTDGAIYYICCDASGESAQLFSTLAASAGCTSTVAPGQGGTSNAFPSKGIAIRGSGSVGGPTSDGWTGYSSTLFGTGTHAQIGCANATASSGVTADGSFYIVASTSTAGQMCGFCFTRLDDTEPGDVDPFAWFFNAGQSLSAWVGTGLTSSSFTDSYSWTLNNMINNTSGNWMGYQSRGNSNVTSRDVSVNYTGSLAYSPLGNSYAIIASSAGAMLTLNSAATTPPTVREPILLHCAAQTSGTFRQIKGRARWVMASSQGNALDTFDTKTWLVAVSSASNVPAILVGPYDGSTTPSA